jgi:uncharacterized membrane protein
MNLFLFTLVSLLFIFVFIVFIIKAIHHTSKVFAAAVTAHYRRLKTPIRDMQVVNARDSLNSH